MNSYLHDYQPYQRLLFVLGLCPFELNKQTGRTRSSRRTLLYNIAYILCILPISVVLIYYRIAATFRSFDKFADTEITVNCVQICMDLMVYNAVIICIHKKRIDHQSFLNGMADLDNRIYETFAIENLDERPFLRRIYVENILVLVYSASIRWLEMVFEDPVESETNVILISFMHLAFVSMYMVMMYVRKCGQLLQRRFSVIHKRLWWALRSSGTCSTVETCRLFDLLEDALVLKRHYQHAFGLVVLLNSVFDMFLWIVAVYMMISRLFLKENGPSVELFIMVLLYIIWPTVKLILLALALDPFGRQVAQMRAITLRLNGNSMQSDVAISIQLLHLQHLESEIYISANGYFVINYGMIFKMWAAAFTHLMVALQFQLWENNN